MPPSPIPLRRPPLRSEGRSDRPDRSPAPLKLPGPAERLLLPLVGHKLAVLNPEPERRSAVGVATVLGLALPARPKPEGDHAALVLGDGTEHLADELSTRVIGVVAQVARLGGTGREDLAAEPPHLGEQRLLDDQVTGETVEPVDDEAVGRAAPEGAESTGVALMRSEWSRSPQRECPLSVAKSTVEVTPRASPESFGCEPPTEEVSLLHPDRRKPYLRWGVGDPSERNANRR